MIPKNYRNVCPDKICVHCDYFTSLNGLYPNLFSLDCICHKSENSSYFNGLLKYYNPRHIGDVFDFIKTRGYEKTVETDSCPFFEYSKKLKGRIDMYKTLMKLFPNAVYWEEDYHI